MRISMRGIQHKDSEPRNTERGMAGSNFFLASTAAMKTTPHPNLTELLKIPRVSSVEAINARWDFVCLCLAL